MIPTQNLQFVFEGVGVKSAGKIDFMVDADCIRHIKAKLVDRVK